jgi:carboxylesterase
MARRLQEEKPHPRDPDTQVIRGAEAFDFPAAPGTGPGAGSHAILFLHGWTSSPRELRFLAEKAASAGFRCLGPRLKGHGLTVRALRGVLFADHLAEGEEAFASLAMSHERVSVCGLSMGGLVALHLAARRRVANLVLIAPFVKPAGTTFGLPNRWLVGRVPLSEYVGKHEGGPIEDPGARAAHIAYHAMPAAGMESVVQAARDFRGLEKSVACPTLVFHSVRDRTSDFAGSLDLMGSLGSDDKTLVAFNRSNHVLTLDFDRGRLEAEALAWLARRR